MKHARLLGFVNELTELRPGANLHHVFREIAWELEGGNAAKWSAIVPKLNAHAYPSVALDLIPEGFWLSGVRRDGDGWICVLDGARMVSSERRWAISIAIAEAALLSQLFLNGLEIVNGEYAHA